ncbi:MAG: hypothetical protein PHV54_00860 [Tolumonas sp.]|nr:hypothetical protein [Tolumonas sp.]
MRDLLGLICLMVGAAFTTKHFALGIPFFIAAVLFWNNGKTSIDGLMEILGPLFLVCIVLTWVIQIFQAIF